MDYYNASMFETEVLDRLNRLFQIKDTVIMVGGSTLYVDAVVHGIDDLPSVDMELRKQLINSYRTEGIEYLRQQLGIFDPDHFQKVDLMNPNRMMKAIEISMMTGKPYSSLLTATQKVRDFNIVRIGINRERDELFELINSRVDRMIREGLVHEVQQLDYARHTNALRTVGYRELFEYLDGSVTLNEAIEKIKTNTRRYAKRQVTWFSRDKEMRWFHPDAYDKILEFIHSAL
jgi:tRNA dimethylallyltransferase